MTDGQKVFAATMAGFIFVCVFIGSLIYRTDPGPSPAPKFIAGQYVKSALSGQRGQVVRTLCYRGTESCTYMVRFVGPSITTQTSILGPDGPVSMEPLSVVGLHEFELIAD